MSNEPDMKEFTARFIAREESQQALRNRTIIVEENLTWLAVHGAICLALRHPHFVGPTRELLRKFVRELGHRMVLEKILTLAELELIQHTEQSESPHGKD